MSNFWTWLNNLRLPQGDDLALWWLGWICIVALALKIEGAKEITLALGGGIIGFLRGKATATTPPSKASIS